MAISDVDFKVLWGRAAGFCSNPDCLDDLTIVIKTKNYNIGEMAHIIAKKENGPRGIKGVSDDSYHNLILLCPTCHTHIDKAPKGTFTEDEILQWKEGAEKRRSSGFSLSEKFLLEDIFELAYNAFHLQNNVNCLKDKRYILDENWFKFLFQCVNRIKFHSKPLGKFDVFSEEIEHAYECLQAYGKNSENSHSALWYAVCKLNGKIKREFTKDKEKKVVYFSESMANFIYFDLLREDALASTFSMSDSQKNKIFSECELVKDIFLDAAVRISEDSKDVDGIKRLVENYSDDERHDAIYKAAAHVVNKIGI
ncbi:hypothetical protein P353_16830 [Comamonas testosteroni]|uniref:HNH endonuclease n=2 Tax=Comamonas testosteroni TaxID=285 RepID=A0A096FC25_COMTE|nr:hypothetical protein P353_16830 [Comamonas testosteroni]